MNKLIRLLQLDSRRRILLFTTFATLCFVKIGLFSLPFQKLETLTAKTSNFLRQKNRFLGRTSIKEIVCSINTCSKYVPGQAMCLARAITTQTIMQICDYDTPHLKIGVVKAQGGVVLAHAWVEYRGIVVIGELEDLNSYKSLTTPFN